MPTQRLIQLGKKNERTNVIDPTGWRSQTFILSKLGLSNVITDVIGCDYKIHVRESNFIILQAKYILQHEFRQNIT